jgi:hypothetical protein
MNTPDTTVAAQIDELRRSFLFAEQQRIHVEELADHQAHRAKGILTQMLGSIDRLTEYRAMLCHRE